MLSTHIAHNYKLEVTYLPLELIANDSGPTKPSPTNVLRPLARMVFGCSAPSKAGFGAKLYNMLEKKTGSRARPKA